MGPTDYFKFIYGSNIFKDPILPRKRISYTGFLKLCPGKKHAWYETDLGYPVRKELGKVEDKYER
jgi:hypothetical protein